MLNQIGMADPSLELVETIFNENWNPYMLNGRLHGVREFGAINGFSAYDVIPSFLSNSVIQGINADIY